MDSAPGIYVASETRPVYIRVVGRGAFQNSQPLRRFAEEMITKGQREFVIDLAQCAGMDSTFLGGMTGIALRLRQNGNRGSVCIVNASARHRELLQTMGLGRSDAGRDRV